MAILGYVGEFRGADLDALREWGERIARTAPGSPLAPIYGENHSGCWGPLLAGDGPLTLVLSGAPRLLRGGPESDSTAQPDLAAAILEDYRRYGREVLRRLYGPFSLVIVNSASREALLAIDRMGIEGLAYRAGKNRLVFASAADHVAHSPGVDATIYPQALFDYLFHHMIPAPHTVFQGVEKLRAGCCAIFENGAIRVERYWTPHFEVARNTSFADLKSELYAALQGAVERSSETDENVGSFLSGGLDSSTVAGMLTRVGGRPAQTFSIGFGYPDYDELAYARIVNAHFGCEGHEYIVRGSDIVTAFALIARAYDEPFGNASALPTYYCARLARNHGIAHLLAGDGGDELFAGNSRYVEQQVFEHYRLIPAWLRQRLLEPALLGPFAPTSVPFIRKAPSYVRQATTPLPDRLEEWNLLVRLGFSEALCAEFLAAVRPESVFERMREVWESTPSNDYLHHMLYYDWQYTLADNDLRKVGTMCSLTGIHVSYPMLDSAVVDVSTRVPPSLMMPRGKLRHFYKEAMRGFLPDTVITKKKHGFGLPFGLWLAECPELRQMIFDNLSSLRRRRILRPEFLDRMVQLHGEDDSRYYGVFVWVAAMLEQWMHEHDLTI